MPENLLKGMTVEELKALKATQTDEKRIALIDLEISKRK